ncbi:MAG: carbon-nitrogen hydrolase [Desulfuromonadaceae bacterium]|nr:carbon-nitrogen hydrolase [Desulfuromonadaceae bacterium]
MKHLTVAALQLRFGADIEANRRHCAAAIEKAAGQGAELAVLPELHNTPYFCQTEETSRFDLAEPIPGPSTDLFGPLAQHLGITIVLSLFERRAPGLCHNTAVVIDRDGAIAGKYRKMHIPDDPGYYEKFYFTPGDLGFLPVKTAVGSLGVLVCWDQWFPEAARLMTLAGADLLIYPTAIGYDPREDPADRKNQLEAWLTIQRSHAVANGLPVVSVNRIGFEPHPTEKDYGIEFWGNSFVADAQGAFLGRAGDKEEEILLMTIDPARAEATRRIWPFLRDRRIDAYGDLLKRFRD